MIHAEHRTKTIIVFPKLPIFSEQCSPFSMNLLSDFLKLIVPAGLVLYGMYLTVNCCWSAKPTVTATSSKPAIQKPWCRSGLQAYERMVLFLERISPNNLLLRLGGSSTTVLEFQQRLLQEIRESTTIICRSRCT